MMNTTVEVEREMFSKAQMHRIVVPLILEQVSMAAIGTFDIMMISGLGEEAISAVSLVDFINQMVNSILTAMATGGAIVFAHELGQQTTGQARETAKHVFMLLAAMGGVLLCIALGGNGLILKNIYGTIDPAVMEKAKTYFWLSGIGYPFAALFCASAAVIRVLGNTKLSLYMSMCMNLINIMLNALFIFVLQWGVFGAGFASLLSRAIVSAWMLNMVCRHQDKLGLEPLYCWRIRATILVRILRVAVPTTIESTIFYVGQLMVQSLVSVFGTSAIAANAIGRNIAEVLHMPGAGAGIGMITVIGRCVGAGEQRQARNNAHYLVTVTYLLQGVCCVISMVFAKPIASAFNLTQEALDVAVTILVTHGVICTLFWPMGFTMANALKAAGDVRFTMIITTSSMWFFRVGGSYLLTWLFPSWGVLNIWYAMYLDWIARAVVYFLRYRSGAWIKTERKNAAKDSC